MKLYTKPASFRAQKVLIASLYANQKIEIVTDASDKAIKDLSPIAKLPLLSTPEGSIAESNAIARYISNLGAKSLLGKSAVESAQVDSWMDFSANDVEVPATVVCYPIIGWMPLHSEAFDKAKKDLNLTLQTLESHLKTRTYLVGEAITLADIALSTALLLPFKMVFDEKLRKTFPCTTRWFITCVNQVNFKRVIGVTELCKEPLVPKGYKATEAATAAAVPKQKDAKKEAPKKEEAKKEAPKKEKPKPVEEAADEEEEDLVPKEKKPKHYCEELPPSPFVLDTWKRTYSNAPGGDCYKAMPWFWENFDATGFSLWIGEYNFNDELKVPFMISNLAGGFVQRCDEIRKYAFGVLQVLEKDGKYFIKGCFLFRGDTDRLMLEGNEDATSYTWTKLDHTNEANKKVVEDLWCAWEEIEGKKIIDCKVFK